MRRTRAGLAGDMAGIRNGLGLGQVCRESDPTRPGRPGTRKRRHQENGYGRDSDGTRPGLGPDCRGHGRDSDRTAGDMAGTRSVFNARLGGYPSPERSRTGPGARRGLGLGPADTRRENSREPDPTRNRLGPDPARKRPRLGPGLGPAVCVCVCVCVCVSLRAVEGVDLLGGGAEREWRLDVAWRDRGYPCAR